MSSKSGQRTKTGSKGRKSPRQSSPKRRSTERPMPEAMQCLVDEHRHFRDLLKVMAERASRPQKLEVGDYCLLHDIVWYLHDYSDRVHHPTEDRVFARLLEHDDSLEKKVTALRSDHKDIGSETEELLARLSAAIDDPNDTNESSVREVCGAFAAGQKEHMELENRVLFPAAIDRLEEEDWQDIEAYFAAVDDPLFGKVVGKNHRLLYEYLVHPMEEAAWNSAASRMSSLERFERTTDVLEKGAGELASRLKALKSSLQDEGRTALAKSIRPESLMSAMFLPMKFSMTVSKSMLSCGMDMARICSRTASRAVAIRRG